MNRETIVEHVKARDRVIVWTASHMYSRYWVYRPQTNRVDYVCLTDMRETIKLVAKKEGKKGGVWVHGLAGMSALFPVVRCGDEDAEQMLQATLPKIDLGEPMISARRLLVRDC